MWAWDTVKKKIVEHMVLVGLTAFGALTLFFWNYAGDLIDARISTVAEQVVSSKLPDNLSSTLEKNEEVRKRVRDISIEALSNHSLNVLQTIITRVSTSSPEFNKHIEEKVAAILRGSNVDIGKFSNIAGAIYTSTTEISKTQKSIVTILVPKGHKVLVRLQPSYASGADLEAPIEKKIKMYFDEYVRRDPELKSCHESARVIPPGAIFPECIVLDGTQGFVTLDVTPAIEARRVGSQTTDIFHIRFGFNSRSVSTPSDSASSTTVAAPAVLPTNAIKFADEVARLTYAVIVQKAIDVTGYSSTAN